MEIAYLLGLALWGLVPGFIAKRKDRSFWGYFFLTFLISPLITIIIALCVSNKRRKYVPTESIIVEKKTNHKEEPQYLYSSENISGWKCSCGRAHPQYESSCVCGKSKFDIMNSPKTEETSSETAAQPAVSNQIRFCKKCGERLLENSKFCRKCGAEVHQE